MKVLYFHQHFTTPRGASGTRSYEFARALVGQGHDVTMICGSFGAGSTGLQSPFVAGKRSGEVDGIRIIELELPYSNADRFLKRSMTFAKFAMRSIWIALTEKYDLVFATSTPLTAAIPGIFARVFRRKPFVFEVRDLWPELPRAMGVISDPLVLWGLGLLEKTAYRTADHVIGLAPGIVEGVRRKSRDNLGVSLIPNGCDLELFAAKDLIASEIPGVRRGDFVAMFTGAHGIANGLNAVLDVAVELERQGREDIKLVFVGDGMEKPTLLERARGEKLSNCIFLDPVPKLELAECMRGADIGLMILANVDAFYYGTSPNKFFDYIAASMPVLCNYPGWVSDMLEEWQAGVSVSPSDAVAFADVLVEMQNQPERLSAMALQARELAESNFDRKQLAAEFVDVLEAVVDNEKAV